MPPSKEAIVKQIEHDRDFALWCLKRELTDAHTIRRLVGQMKAEGFSNCLSDLMVHEGIISDQIVDQIEVELATGNSKSPRPKSAISNSSAKNFSCPDIPGFRFKNILRERAGILYRVRALGGQQDECLRVLPREIKQRSILEVQFRAAFEKIKVLKHPMLSKLGELRQTREFLYYTSEFVEGPTLEDVLRTNRPFPAPVAMGFIRVLSGVFDHAHRKSVIHRDLHPDLLVFRPDRQMRFKDYGLERLINELVKVDEPDTVRCFRSPEDLKGERAHVADDLFAMGALLYFVVTGLRPPRATAGGNVAIPNLQESAPNLPADVISIITRLLLPRLARISSISELIQALNKPVSKRAPTARADDFLNYGPESPQGDLARSQDSKDRGVTAMSSFGVNPAPPNATASVEAFETIGHLWENISPSDSTVRDDLLPQSAKANPWDLDVSGALDQANHSLQDTIKESVDPALPLQNRASESMAQDAKARINQGPAAPKDRAFDFSAPMPASQDFGHLRAGAPTIIEDPDPDSTETARPGSLPTLKAMQEQRARAGPFAQTLPLPAALNAAAPNAIDPNADTIVPEYHAPISEMAPSFEDYGRSTDIGRLKQSNDVQRPSDQPGHDPHAQTLFDIDEQTDSVPEQDNRAPPSPDDGQETQVMNNPMELLALASDAGAAITALPVAIPSPPRSGPPRPKTDTEIDDEIVSSDDDVDGDEFDPAGQTLVMAVTPLSFPAAVKATADAKNFRSQAHDDFQLMDLIGKRGPWELYAAKQVSTKSKVIFKTLRGGNPSAPVLDQMTRELQTIRRLTGLPMARIIKTGTCKDGAFFIAFEQVEAKTLGSLMAWGAMKFERACDLLVGLLQGLSRAQSVHFIHGTLTEDSVALVQEKDVEHLVIKDFGYDHRLRDLPNNAPFAASEQQPYLAPEFREKRTVDRRSDIYSIGILAYRLFTGHFPFPEGDVAGEIQSFSVLHPQFIAPAGLESFCHKAIAAQPEERFQHYDEMIACLGQLRQEYRSKSQSTKHPESGKRRKVILGLVLVCVVALVAILIFVFKGLI
jgi:serine/threonine protein kinase